MRGWSAAFALVAVSTVLAACTTVTGDRGDVLLAQPMRSVGLALHTVELALGMHGRHLGDGADVSPAAARNAARACSGDTPSVTWLGHSSAIVHLGGVCILTDPVLEAETSALSPLPRRLAMSTLGVDALPSIDAVIVSHGDYDHLHSPTIRALARRFPDATVLVPEGVRRPVVIAGYRNAIEARPGQSTRIGRVTAAAEPAHHETRRTATAIKTGDALSWVLTDGDRRVLFVGDTGYGPAFEAIGRAWGPFDALLVPIGAYEPREIVARMHATPEESVRIARDVGARLAIGIHWGTFALSPDTPEEAVRRFLRAGAEAGIETRVLAIGETIAIP